jgi:hypothetical protein
MFICGIGNAVCRLIGLNSNVGNLMSPKLALIGVMAIGLIGNIKGLIPVMFTFIESVILKEYVLSFIISSISICCLDIIESRQIFAVLPIGIDKESPPTVICVLRPFVRSYDSSMQALNDAAAINIIARTGFIFLGIVIISMQKS